MPIKGEQHGYTYKALINGEWQEVTIQESPLELAEWFEQNEEWTRVRHGHWEWHKDACDYFCSNCKRFVYSCSLEIVSGEYQYCPHCGARMDEVENAE